MRWGGNLNFCIVNLELLWKGIRQEGFTIIIKLLENLELNSEKLFNLHIILKEILRINKVQNKETKLNNF